MAGQRAGAADLRHRGGWIERRRQERAIHRALTSTGFSAGEMPRLVALRGCPVCRSVLERMRGFLFWYAEEVYNSPDWVEQMLRSRGFCQAHTWELAGMEARHELTFMASPLVRRSIRGLEGLAAALRRGRGPLLERIGSGRTQAVRALAPSEPCAFCTMREDDTRDLHDLLRALRDPATGEAFVQGGGLCLPHATRAASLLQRAGSPLLDRLLEAQEQAFMRRLGDSAMSAFGQGPAAALVAGIAGRRFPAAGTLRQARTLPLDTAARAFDQHRRIDHEWTRSQLPAGAPLEVLQALPGCALCRLVERDRYDLYLRLIEDMETSALATLCHLHAWEALDCDTEQRLLPAWHGILRQRYEALQQRVSPAGSGPEKEDGCAACQGVQQSITRDGGRFVEGGLIAGSPPLCLPHLLALTRKALPAIARPATLRLARALAALDTEIAEYFRLLDYRFADVPKGHEQSAGLRAMALLSGSPPLYRREHVERLSLLGGWTSAG